MLTAAELKRRLILNRIADAEDIVGCSEEDIRLIETANGVRLPQAYRALLATSGRRAGDFLTDCTAFFPAIVGLTAEERKAMEGIVELPPRAFVFLDRMGEAFLFFVADGTNDDPPIYGWSESRDQPEQIYDSVWEFVEEELENEERHRRVT
jgi:hypothetical protein